MTVTQGESIVLVFFVEGGGRDGYWKVAHVPCSIPLHIWAALIGLNGLFKLNKQTNKQKRPGSWE